MPAAEAPRAVLYLPGLAAPVRPLVLVAAESGAGARGRDGSRAGAPVQRKPAGTDPRPPPPKPPPPAVSGAAADPGYASPAKREEDTAYRSCSPVSRTSAMCSSSAAFCCMVLMPSSIAAGLRAQHRRVRGDPGLAAPRPRCPRRQLRAPPARPRTSSRGWRAATATSSRSGSPERLRSLFPSAGSDPSRRFPCYCVTGRRRNTWLQPPRRSRARRGSSGPPRLSHGRVGAAPAGSGRLPAGSCEPSGCCRCPPRQPRPGRQKAAAQGGAQRSPPVAPSRGCKVPRPPFNAGLPGGRAARRSSELGRSRSDCAGGDATAARSGSAGCALAVINGDAARGR